MIKLKFPWIAERRDFAAPGRSDQMPFCDCERKTAGAFKTWTD
jgi:hypothetical protein